MQGTLQAVTNPAKGSGPFLRTTGAIRRASPDPSSTRSASQHSMGGRVAFIGFLYLHCVFDNAKGILLWGSICMKVGLISISLVRAYSAPFLEICRLLLCGSCNQTIELNGVQ